MLVKELIERLKLADPEKNVQLAAAIYTEIDGKSERILITPDVVEIHDTNNEDIWLSCESTVDFLKNL